MTRRFPQVGSRDRERRTNVSRSTTIVIAARNAETTIERAVASACMQGSHPILLVDDFSADKTIARALDCAGGRLRIVRPAAHSTLGAARQTGLAEIRTPFGVWLDADDEFLPGRVDHMVAELKTGRTDLVSDEVELCDGQSGTSRGILHIPQFLKEHHPLAHLFERNYLPGVGVLGFSTDFARRVGYDPRFHGAEDIDFVLRAIVAGARFSLMNRVGYRLYAYPGSLSRRIENQRIMYREALRKHDYAHVKMIYRSAGHDDRTAIWGLVSMAIFREEYESALKFAAELEMAEHRPERVHEPDGPSSQSENWRLLFYRGTILLLLGRASDALMHLRECERLNPTAEGANNLGVAFRATGDSEHASILFSKSLALRPGYLDAQLNLENESLFRVTTHPFRLVMNRDDYVESPPLSESSANRRAQREEMFS